MKVKKISFFLFFIIFSSLLSSEITYLSSKTFQDENAIQIVISINSTEEIDKSDISIFEYQTSSSIKDSLFNLNLSRVCLLYTSPSPRDQRGSRMPCCG